MPYVQNLIKKAGNLKLLGKVKPCWYETIRNKYPPILIDKIGFEKDKYRYVPKLINRKRITVLTKNDFAQIQHFSYLNYPKVPKIEIRYDQKSNKVVKKYQFTEFVYNENNPKGKQKEISMYKYYLQSTYITQ